MNEIKPVSDKQLKSILIIADMYREKVIEALKGAERIPPEVEDLRFN